MGKRARASLAIGLFAFLLSLPPAFAAEKVTYYHFDALGSPVAATDEQGNVVWRETYQPYGERIRKEPASSANPRWYTGHPEDAETGLLYLGARYYDPVLGRFYAVDPVAFTEKNPHSFNRYAYGNNNPYRYIITLAEGLSETIAWYRAHHGALSLNQRVGLGKA